MGLVDYSDSESDSDTSPHAKSQPTGPTAEAATTTSSAKKPFQKIVNRANPGKILVSLPSTSTTSASTAPSDEPPAKRVKTSGTSASRFSDFRSFLPPPKPAAVKPAAPTSTSSRPAPRPGVHLKTSAEAAFSRNADDDDEDTGASNLDLPAPKGPSIPAGQKAADEVKLVGKPLMFKPLSVARKPGKKSGGGKGSSIKAAAVTTTTAARVPSTQEVSIATATATKAPNPKKVSLFSLGEDDTPAIAEPLESPEPPSPPPDIYAPTYTSTTSSVTAPYDTLPTAPPPPQSLDTIADEMNLSPAARRALFGRPGQQQAKTARVANLDMEAEYAHNEALRTAGEQAPAGHNPLRALQPGKHSLQQLVNAVANQREALEETFAQNRAKQREAGGRYGWK